MDLLSLLTTRNAMKELPLTNDGGVRSSPYVTLISLENPVVNGSVWLKSNSTTLDILEIGTLSN
jgi:hypothetical protein